MQFALRVPLRYTRGVTQPHECGRHYVLWKAIAHGRTRNEAHVVTGRAARVLALVLALTVVLMAGCDVPGNTISQGGSLPDLRPLD